MRQSTSEASDKDATPKPKPKVQMSGGDSGVKESGSDTRLEMAHEKKGGNGEKGAITQIVLFESPNGAGHEELQKFAIQELGGSLEELRGISRYMSAPYEPSITLTIISTLQMLLRDTGENEIKGVLGDK
jgi:hypothetical protein